MPYNELRIGRWSQPGGEYLVTAVVEGRRRLFVDLDTARPVIDALCASEGDWLAWVLMPDHFHGLLRLSDDQLLDVVMQCFKGASARGWNQRQVSKGRLWQPGFHDRAMRVDDDRREAARYIVANPVRAGLVDRVGDYPFWGASWL